ncbi:MAG: cell division protein FtsA [Bacteroidales bacterium]|jgi:cell division protein FtsA|nr:cell division protein FtsA [Bacteroidales bacterium]
MLEISFKKSRRKYPDDSEEAKIAVGLDIGTTKVVAFVGQRNSDGKIEILGFGKHISLGVQRGQVINIDKTAKAIRQAIIQAENKANIDIDTVMVGIAGQHINNTQIAGEIKRRNSDSEITKEDVRILIDDMFKVAVNPGSQIIDIIPQEYTVDSITGLDDPIGVLGTQLSSVFNVVTGNSQHIRNIIRCVKRCKLEMDGLVVEPIASAEVVLDKKEKETGVALVDIGGGTTDIAVFINGILRHTAVIPIGGDVITDDIKAVFKGIVKEEAESLKVKHGSCLPNKGNDNLVVSIPGIKGRPATEIPVVELAEVIAARTKEIIQRISDELKNANCFNKLGCGIVLTGGGARLQDIKEFTEYHTGLSVRIGNPEENIIIGKDSEYYHPMYATGLGLMILGIEKGEDLHAIKEERNERTGSSKKTGKQTKKQIEGSGERDKYRPPRPWDKIKELLYDLVSDDDMDDDFEDD